MTDEPKITAEEVRGLLGTIGLEHLAPTALGDRIRVVCQELLRRLENEAAELKQAEEIGKIIDNPPAPSPELVRLMRTAADDKSFVGELSAAINRHSRENDSDTPDYILAEFLASCLAAYGTASKRRAVFLSGVEHEDGAELSPEEIRKRVNDWDQIHDMTWSEDRRSMSLPERVRASMHCKTCTCGRRVPVQAQKGGSYKDSRWDATWTDHGAGTISWEEHVAAWNRYAIEYPGQSAERMAERGGFGYGELCMFLGHDPKTWAPSKESR